jgi:hypothetical protein
MTLDDRQNPPLRVFQTKDQTRSFYDKISRFYDLLRYGSKKTTATFQPSFPPSKAGGLFERAPWPVGLCW